MSCIADKYWKVSGYAPSNIAWNTITKTLPRKILPWKDWNVRRCRVTCLTVILYLQVMLLTWFLPSAAWFSADATRCNLRSVSGTKDYRFDQKGPWPKTLSAWIHTRCHWMDHYLKFFQSLMACFIFSYTWFPHNNSSTTSKWACANSSKRYNDQVCTIPHFRPSHKKRLEISKRFRDQYRLIRRLDRIFMCAERDSSMIGFQNDFYDTGKIGTFNSMITKDVPTAVVEAKALMLLTSGWVWLVLEQYYAQYNKITWSKWERRLLNSLGLETTSAR